MHDIRYDRCFVAWNGEPHVHELRLGSHCGTAASGFSGGERPPGDDGNGGDSENTDSEIFQFAFDQLDLIQDNAEMASHEVTNAYGERDIHQSAQKVGEKKSRKREAGAAR